MIVFAILAALLLTACSTTPPPKLYPSGRLPDSVSRHVDSPFGWLEFCTRSVTHPACRPGGADRVHLTERLKAELEEVNAEVNRLIKPASERDDFWRGGGPAGDCEDFALAKMARLTELGWPPSSLRLATGYLLSVTAEYHVVLVAMTDRGDMVLDYDRDRLLTPDESRIVFYSMQHADRSWRQVLGLSKK